MSEKFPFLTEACQPLTEFGDEGNTCFWESFLAYFLLNKQPDNSNATEKKEKEARIFPSIFYVQNF